MIINVVFSETKVTDEKENFCSISFDANTGQVVYEADEKCDLLTGFKLITETLVNNQITFEKGITKIAISKVESENGPAIQVLKLIQSKDGSLFKASDPMYIHMRAKGRIIQTRLSVARGVVDYLARNGMEIGVNYTIVQPVNLDELKDVELYNENDLN